MQLALRASHITFHLQNLQSTALVGVNSLTATNCQCASGEATLHLVMQCSGSIYDRRPGWASCQITASIRPLSSLWHMHNGSLQIHSEDASERGTLAERHGGLTREQPSQLQMGCPKGLWGELGHVTLVQGYCDLSEGLCLEALKVSHPCTRSIAALLYPEVFRCMQSSA